MKLRLLIAMLLAGCSAAAQSANLGIGTTTPGSRLTVVGSIAGSYTSTTSTAYTVGANDYYIAWNGAAGGTATLPATTTAIKGRTYKIKNNTALYTLSIAVSGGQYIEGAATVSLLPGYEAELIANGSSTPGTTCWELITAMPAITNSADAGAAAGTLGSSSGTCSPSPSISGLIVTGTTLTNQFVTVTVTPTKTGNYAIATNTVNGIHFEATGYFSATGTQTVKLMGKGTPASAGSYTYTFAFGGSTCTFTL